MSYFTCSCCGEDLPAEPFLATNGWQNQDVCVYCLDEIEAARAVGLLSDPISLDETPW